MTQSKLWMVCWQKALRSQWTCWRRGLENGDKRRAAVGETCVLDSFAVLALLGRESGSTEVKELLQRAKRGEVCLSMTWVNVGEVTYIVERRWGREQAYRAIGMLEATAVRFIAVGRELALQAAEIKAKYPLAYADAFAAALAIKEGGTLVTGDPEFEQLEGILPIRWLTPGKSPGQV